MQPKTHKLGNAIRIALWAGAIALAGAVPAMAQDAPSNQAIPAAAGAEDTPPDEGAVTLDTMVVTGSRIAIPGLTTNSPVLTVERDRFEQEQPVTVEDLIKTLPGAVSAIGSAVNNGADGAATIDLRGLGANRTLVLLDGRRMVPYDLNAQVDTNLVPIALLERIDVVTGGASAVYGADAVAGVVNFILRRDFEGVEVSSSIGQSTGYSDGQRLRTDLVIGANVADGRGNVAMSVGYTDTDTVVQEDRPYSRFSRSSGTGNVQGSLTGVPTRVEYGTRNGQIDTDSGALVDQYSTFNFAPFNLFQTPLNRYQITALGRYELSDKAEVYAQALSTRSMIESELAPSGIFGDTLPTPIGNAFIPEPARQQLCAEFGIVAAQCVAGNPTLVPITYYRRFTELGPRLNDFTTNTLQYTVGLRGDLGDRWRYDTYWSQGRSDQLERQINWGSLSKTIQALNAVSETQCVDSSNGCVPINLWGGEGSITPEMLDFINLTALLTTEIRQDVFSASATGDFGDAFKSPWAGYPIGAAFGVERRETSATSLSDAASQIPGEVLGSGGATLDTEGSYTLEEAYGELLMPLVTDKPFMYALTLEAGYRRTNFEADESSEYGSYKYGGEWAPVESLRFRGMFQRATRAPNIEELYRPVTTQLDNLDVDPCQGDLINAGDASTPGTLSNLCVLTGVPIGRVGFVSEPSAGQANIQEGGNRRLGPEKADTRTFGLVWQPTFIDDLAITLDYWDIELNEMISRPTIDDVLDACYNPAKNPGLTLNDFCRLIGREPTNGSLNGTATAPGVARPLSNQGRLNTDGIDLGVRFSVPLADGWGRLGFTLDATKTLSYDYQATPISVNRDCLGYYSVACNSVPEDDNLIAHEFKSNLRTTWYVNDFNFTLGWRYLSSVEEEPGGGTFLPAYSRIPSYSYFDLAVGWNLPWNMRVNLTVNNLLDKEPPIVGNTIGGTAINSGNTFPTYYDAIGRYVTLGATFRF